MVLKILALLMDTAAVLCHDVSRGLENLRDLIDPSLGTTSDLASPSESPTILPDWLLGVPIPDEPPPWAGIDVIPGDYKTWFVEQLELRHSAPHRVDPSFGDHESWARAIN